MVRADRPFVTLRRDQDNRFARPSETETEPWLPFLANLLRGDGC